MSGNTLTGGVASSDLEHLAVTLFQQGRYEEAAGHFVDAICASPQSSRLYCNLGSAWRSAGNLEASLDAYQRAVALDAESAIGHLNVADLLGKLGRWREAIEAARRTVAAFSEDPNVQYHGGRILNTQGVQAEALVAFERALRLDPHFAEARWMRAMATLPQAYGPGQEPEAFRDAFDQQLWGLDTWVGENAAIAHRGVGEGQPFYLAFQERDNVSLLSRHGDLCSRAMAAGGMVSGVPRSSHNRGPVRLAIVSGYFYDQSVWTALVRGWCRHLDRSRVEAYLFHTGTTVDSETDVARSSAADFYTGLGDVSKWIDGIRSVRPDIILYPEIGMNAMSLKLAALRLAPMQIVSWGHPETSGLPTIDYYLSAAAFEPPGAESHYREKLALLPNLGCCYEDLAPAFDAPDWALLGVDPYAPRLLCAGTACKYLPIHDDVFVEIARRVPDVQLLFFADSAPMLSELVQQRLAAAFSKAGLDHARNVRLLPRQSRAAFFGIMRDSDAMLDTIGFSGFNTAMQAIECDLPIVAWEGKFMRGRLASGTLRAIGMDELVASTREQYIGLASRLCLDATHRLRVVSRLAEQKRTVFGDLAPVRALEEFLGSVTKGRA